MASKLPNNTLRFDAFDRPVSYGDVRKELPEIARKLERNLAWTAAFVAAFIGFMLIPIFGGSGGFEPAAAIVTFVVMMALIVGTALPYVLKRNVFGVLRMKRFADENGLAFIHDEKDPARAGMIFNEGHSRKLTLGFVMTTKAGRAVEIANYRYVVGSGKNRREVTWGYARIELSRHLPRMVIDGQRNNFFGSNLPDVFASSQKLKLEGEFSEYFDLYVPAGYERDALYVLTPDVMALLLDEATGYDLEITGDQLFLYAKEGADLHSRQGVEKMVGLAQRVQAEFEEQADYYADERVGDRSLNVVAEGGRTLKKGVNWLGVVLIGLIVFVMYGGDVPLPDEVKRIVMIGALVLIVGMFAREIRRKQKLQKRR